MLKFPSDHHWTMSTGMADLDVSRLLAGLQRGAVPGPGCRPENGEHLGEMGVFIGK